MKKNFVATLALAATLPLALSACGNASSTVSSAESRASNAASQASSAAPKASAAASSAATQAASAAATNSAVASATANTGSHKIVYKVTTTTKSTVAYSNGKDTAREDITADWTKEVQSTPGLNAAVLSIVNTDVTNANANVSCEILVDGVSKAKNTGKGTTANATCNATF